MAIRTASGFISLLTAGFLSAGCDDAVSGPDLGPTVGPEHDGLRIEVAFPDTVDLGEEIRFHVTLTNTRTTPYVMPLPHFDVFVMDGGGEVVWNYLYGAGVIGTEMVIAPGEAFESELPWDQSRNEEGMIEPGRFRVLAVFFDLPPALVTEVRHLVVIERARASDWPLAPEL